MSSSLAPSPLHAIVADWRSEIENRFPRASPYRSMPPTRWVPMREAAFEFCDHLRLEPSHVVFEKGSA